MSSNDACTSAIEYVTIRVNRHLALLVLLFGTIGNLLNIWVLRDRSLTNNSCSTYLWWSSLSSIIFLWSGILTRVLQGYGINWPNQNPAVCKIRLLILTICLAVATWTLVGASIDRYLRSSLSAHYRQLGSVQTAKRYVMTTMIVSMVIFVEILYCYEASVPNVPVACYPQSLPCRLYNDWMIILFINIIPGSFMAIFTLLLVRNIRTRVVQPIRIPTGLINTVQNQHIRPVVHDRHINKMLLIQVLVVLFLSLPVAIQRLYSSLTANYSKTPHRLCIENLIYALIVLLSFFAYSLSFYLYTLTGSIYRLALKRSMHRLSHRIRQFY